MAPISIYSERFVLPGGVFGPGYLPIVDGKFGAFTVDRPEGDVVDASGKWVAPGLVDTHIHGFFNHATTDKDPEGMNVASVELARRGTTSWLPTTFTQGVDDLGACCASIFQTVDSRGSDFVGARIQGIFLEGPFFTMKHVGAQNPAFLIDPKIEILEGWQRAAHGIIRKSALAPERAGSVEYVSAATAMGVKCAIGHSDATYEQSLAAVAAGASVFVHTYNGMRGLHHRDPGVVGCAMATRDTYAEIICDGKHVTPGACQVLVNAKGWAHVVLITDCLACGGMPEGDYMSGGLPVVMRDGLCYLRDGGSIAGSVLTLVQGVKNFYDWGIVTAEQAIRMATEVPARANGIDRLCGSIIPGRDADLVLLNSDLTLDSVYVGGSLVE